MPDIVFFNDIMPSLAEEVGGKGYSLGLMAQQRLPVPSGFCVTATAYRQHGGASGRISDGLWMAIVAAYQQLGSGLVAVRSSATAEDGAEASFAGQQETILGVHGEATLRQAIERCWQSLHTERAKAYRLKQGIDDSTLAMGVVVQQLVEADVAGVMFTVDPWDATGKHLRIEASWGLGEAVVSGRVTPDRFQVHATTGQVTERTAGLKTLRIDNTGEQPVPAEQQAVLCLTDSQIEALRTLAFRVTDYYREPRDIEWAIRAGECYLLQARPITTVTAQEREAARQETIARLKQLAEPDGTVWSHTNLKEILKSPTPLTWSIVSRYLLSGSGGTGRMFAAVGYTPDPALAETSAYDLIGGKPYLNLSREPRLQFANPLFGYPLAMYKTHPHLALNPQPDTTRMLGGFGKWFRVFKMLKIATRIASGSKSFDVTLRNTIIPAYEKWLAPFISQSLAEYSPKQLEEQIHELIQKTLVEFAAESLKPTLYTDYSWKIVEQQLIKAFGSERAGALMAQLSQGAKPDATADFATALKQVGSGQITREAFLHQFGHRGANEMELSAPRWSEASDTLNQLLGSQHTASEHDQQALLAEISKEAKWNPYLAKMVRHHVERIRTFISLRETGKHHLMRGYAEIRRRLVEIDRRLKLNGLLFEATLSEIPAVLAGQLTLAELGKRKRRRQIEATLELPAVIFADDLEAIGRALPLSDGNTQLTGLALSAGVIEGIALVLNEPQDAPPEPGYILVCPSTDPAWVPLFIAAGGLVMESGGTLSHGAIVAREFGLPAVAGIPDLMRRIQTGQRLRVDGTRGTVTLL